MSFIRLKEIPPGSGNYYSYLVENHRDKNGNVRQKVLKYLGTGDHRKKKEPKHDHTRDMKRRSKEPWERGRGAPRKGNPRYTPGTAKDGKKTYNVRSEVIKKADVSGVEKAMKHPDKPGAGAKARKDADLTPEQKFKVVMKEYKRGTLRSSSGEKVTKRDQALAIAFSESGLARENEISIKKIKKDKWQWKIIDPNGSVINSGYTKSKVKAEKILMQ